MLLGLLGILAGLGFLIWLSYRGWSVLLLAPAAALVAAAAAGEPLLAHWTETFMGGAAKFLAQFFPLFLLGALFGKLMDDSGSVETIARFMTERLGTARAILAVTLAGASVTYGGVSLFVAFFVLVPMAQSLFNAADIPRRLVPAAVALGTMTFHVRVARHPCPAKCDTDALLRHHALRSSRPRHRRRRHHARLWTVVAQPCGSRRAPRR
jgi:H+/gluconate symporter-like permease